MPFPNVSAAPERATPGVKGQQDSNRDFSYVRKVVVIGAGVAGLQTARHLIAAGIKVVVLEAASEVGGVWRQNYSGYGLQVPKDMYVFPEFPYPKDIYPKDEYPTGKEVHKYIKAYTAHFDLNQHIKLRCKVMQVRPYEQNRWQVLFHDLKRDKFFQVHVDFVVVSNGLYSHPYVPLYEGAEAFVGTQMHAKDFTSQSIIKSRNVLIVGSGKTALDCVAEVAASKQANSVIMLYRQSHWPLPRFLGGVGIRSVLFNRAITSTLPPFYDEGPASRACSACGNPFKRLFWWSLERYCKAVFHLDSSQTPTTKLPLDLFYGGQILNNNYKSLVDSGLVMKKGEIQCFTRNGVILTDGSFLAADCIIYGTGYTKTYDYLTGDVKSRLGLQKDGLYLYRHIMSPSIPNLAFIGAEVSTYNNILTQALQAMWLTKLLTGSMQLPSQPVMQEDVRLQQM